VSVATSIGGKKRSVACADTDLECLAAAAQQLQHVEKLNLGDVLVSVWLAAGVHFPRRLRLCLMWLHEELSSPAHCMSTDLRCIQVTSGGLQRLLALPALVELTVHTFTDDLPEDAAANEEIFEQRDDTLMDGLSELRSLFALHGRSLNTNCR
jgi:hypothetical protein